MLSAGLSGTHTIFNCTVNRSLKPQPLLLCIAWLATDATSDLKHSIPALLSWQPVLGRLLGRFPACFAGLWVYLRSFSYKLSGGQGSFVGKNPLTYLINRSLTYIPPSKTAFPKILLYQPMWSHMKLTPQGRTNGSRASMVHIRCECDLTQRSVALMPRFKAIRKAV